MNSTDSVKKEKGLKISVKKQRADFTFFSKPLDGSLEKEFG